MNATSLQNDVRAVIAAIEAQATDTIWILPPYQAEAVHESVVERLQAIMGALESFDQSESEKLQKAKKAIAYALTRIKDNWQIGYHMGPGTQAYALLTEAAALLYDEPEAKVYANFSPQSQGKSDTQLMRDIREAWEYYQSDQRRAPDREHPKTTLIERLKEILK